MRLPPPNTWAARGSHFPVLPGERGTRRLGAGRLGHQGACGHPARGRAGVGAARTQPPAAATCSPHLSGPVSARWSCYYWTPGCWSPPGQASARPGSRCCRCPRSGCSCRGPPWGGRGRDPRASGRGRSRCRSRCDGGRGRAPAR